MTPAVVALLAACPAQVPQVSADAGVEAVLGARIATVCVLGAALDLPDLTARADAGLLLEATQEDLEALMATGRFRDARALAVPVGGGAVTLVYSVEPYPPLEDLAVSGSRRVDPALVFPHGMPLSPTRIRAGLDTLGERYASVGYPGTRIDTSLDGGTLVVDVREGLKLTVRQIRFSGNTHVAPPALKGALLMNPGDAFSAELIRADALRLVSALRDRGYLEAEVAPPEPRELPGKPGQVDVVYVVKEGPLYRAGHVAVNGWKGKAPLRPLETQPGKPYSVGGAARDVDRLKHQASEQGVEVEVRLTPAIDAAAHTIGASFEVTKRKAGIGPF